MGRVSSGGTTIRFEVHGDGPPLLLIAGTGYPGATWPPIFVDGLAEDFSTVVYDHRGTGASPGTDETYTTRLLAADAAAVLRSIGGVPAAVVGHSMGGRVAQWLATDEPDLVDSLVLAATGPGHGLGSGQAPVGIPVPTVLKLVELGYEGFIRERQSRTFFTADFVKANPDEVRWLGDAFWEHRPTLHEYLKHVVARQSHDSSSFLTRLDVPTLVMVGELDTHQGDTGSHVDQARYLARQIPRATLETIPGMRHGFFWESPDRSIETVRSWALGTSRSAPSR